MSISYDRHVLRLIVINISLMISKSRSRLYIHISAR